MRNHLILFFRKISFLFFILFISVFFLNSLIFAQSPYADSGWLNYYDYDYSGDIIATDVRIPYSTNKTYYCALQWNGGIEGGGYCGLQKKGAYSGGVLNKHIHFALWNPIANNENIETLYLYNDEVIVEDFGGEGIGKKVLFPFEWEENKTYKLFVRVWHQNSFTNFGFWFNDITYNEWYHIVTLAYPIVNINIESFACFLEDFGATNDNSRKMLLNNGWKRKLNNEWLPLITSTFNVNPINYDFNAGVEENFYFIEIGGNTSPSITPGTQLSISSSADVPSNLGIEIIDYNATFGEALFLSWNFLATKNPPFSVHLKVYDNNLFSGVPIFEIDSLGISSNSLNISLSNTVEKYYFMFHLKSIFDEHSQIIIDSVETNNTGIPVQKNNLNSFSLYQNYPNPFNPSTTISYSIPKSEFVQLNIYDTLGKEVASLVNVEQSLGNYEIKFNASTLASGIYFYRLQSGSFTETKMLILLR